MKRTSPPNVRAKQIAHVTDLHVDEAGTNQHGVDARKNWQILLQDVRSRGIERIAFGGDIGEKSVYAWFFDSLQGFELDMVLGNHDQCQDVTEFFRPPGQSKPDGLYYCRDDDDFRYIFLDSSSGEISDPQLEWFRRQLGSSKSLMLFIHHPILAIDTPVDRKFSLEGREKIVAELQKLPRQTIVLCGHYHMADETNQGMIQQRVTPASCFQVVKEADPIVIDSSSFGYRIITMQGNCVTSQVVSF